MKLIRLTDTHYILDAGPDVHRRQLEEIQNYFADWWAKETDVPTTVVIGGHEEPLVYEDRREPDLEARLKRLEGHIHFTEIDHGWTRGPIPPVGTRVVVDQASQPLTESEKRLMDGNR